MVSGWLSLETIIIYKSGRSLLVYGNHQLVVFVLKSYLSRKVHVRIDWTVHNYLSLYRYEPANLKAIHLPLIIGV